MEKSKKKIFILNKDLYFVTKFNVTKDILWALVISIPISILYNSFKSYDEAKAFKENIESLNYISVLASSAVSFISSFVVRTIFINNIKLNKKIKAGDFQIGTAFFNLIENILYDLDNKDENEKKKRIRETSYFLKTNNSRTGKALQFEPDNTAINKLHTVKGMISVTEAAPSEWLNPTYNFFLINNYIASISQKILMNSPISAIKFSGSRDEEHFKVFEKSKKEVLRIISELDLSNNLINYLSENKTFIRFYILSEEEIASNKSIIETLIAGHDLFGCYVYFINQKVMNDLLKDDVDKKRFMTFIQSVNYKLEDNKEKIDLAVALVGSKLEVIYRKEDVLVIQPMEDVNSIEFQSFIKKLCGLLHSNYEQSTHLFDSYFKSEDYTLNKQFCHIIIDKVNHEEKP